MIADFIKIEDGLIAGLFSGPVPDGPMYAPVPPEFVGRLGEPVAVFNPDWSLKSPTELIDAGLLELGPADKLEGGSVVRKTELELYADGVVPLPPGQVLDGGELRSMTFAERIRSGQLTGVVAKSSVWAALDASLNSRLSVGFVYQGKLFQGDQRAQSNATALLSAINAGFTEPITWRCADNTFIEFTACDFKGFAFALLAFVQGVYAQVWGWKDAVSLAENDEQIVAVVAAAVLDL